MATAPKPTATALLTALVALCDLDPATGLPVRHKLSSLPDMPADYPANLKRLMDASTTGTPATPAPVVTAAPAGGELLPADFQKGFTLMGNATKQFVLDVVKDAVYNVQIEVTDLGNGGGAQAQFLNPDFSGFGYKKLDPKINTWQIKSPVTGKRPFAVAGNGGTSSIKSVSLTKV
jgi:hypothetical protein